jgi:hypothetical protein
MAKRTKQPWRCRCGFVNVWNHRKCRDCAKAKPKRQLPKHQRQVRALTPEQAAELSQLAHGGERGACAICGRARGSRSHDRDHDHRTGTFRGLLCWHCNRELLRRHTRETLERCIAYLERAERMQA